LTGTVPLGHILGMSLADFMRDTKTTDQALADKLGVSRPHITKIRSGKRQPSLPLAIEMARITKLPVSAFIKSEAA